MPKHASEQFVNQRFVDMSEPTGFIRKYPDTMGIMELSPDGTTVYRIDQNGILTSRSDGQFATGFSYATPASAREFVIFPAIDLGTYKVYIEGTSHKIAILQKVTFSNQSGLQYVYHDSNGDLAVALTFDFTYFEGTPITSIVYGNAITNELVVFADERHGIQMDGATHRNLHFTEHTKWVSGMSLQGLTSGGTTYSSISSGVAYDEDIYMAIAEQTNAPFLYLNGIVWDIEADLTSVALRVGGVTQYNLNTNGVYSLSPVTGNDCMIVFFALTNNKLNPYMKLLGQRVYSSANDARAGISSALEDLYLAGLPTPEFKALSAVIVNASGQVQALSDGSLLYDLRKAV